MDNFMANPAYRRYDVLRTKLNSGNDNSVLFSSFYYKGAFPEGNCDAFNNYLNSYMTLPYDNAFFSEVTASFEIFDLKTRKSRTDTSTCRNLGMLAKMVDSFKTGADFEFPCDNHSWRVYMCNSQPVVCLNCKRSCVASEACPGNKFYINPCQTCPDSIKAVGANLRFTYSFQPLHPEYIGALNITAASTSIHVQVNLTKAGRLYCAAFQQSVVLQSHVEVRAQDSVGYMTGTGLVTVLIERLAPDTLYDVYCFTEDFSAHVMPMPDMIASKTTVQTKCCRRIIFPSSYPRVPDMTSSGTAIQPKLSFELNSLPTTALGVILSLIPHPCDDNSIGGSKFSKLTYVTPSVFNFTAKSSSLVGSFVVRGYQGCYTIIASAYAQGNDLYALSRGEVAIVNLRVFTPSAPAVVSVRFSDDGQNIIFTFNTATAMPIFNSTIFACSNIVTFLSANASNCRWSSTSTLIASMTSIKSGQLPSLSEEVGLLGGIVQSACVPGGACAQYPFSVYANFTIMSPVAPIIPVISLSGPASVGACSDIKLDPTSTIGHGGRPWKNVRWSVSNNQSPDNLTFSRDIIAMTAHLNANYSDAASIAFIPNHLLTVGVTYNFYLQLTNFLGKYSVGSTSVTVSANKATPLLSIAGPSTLLKYRWQSLSLTALASIPSCAGATDQGLVYTWYAFKGPQYLPKVLSESADPRVFKLNPYVLDALSSYTIQVKAVGKSYTDPVLGSITPMASADVLIQTGQSGVVARIAGGEVQTAKAGAVYVLDASGSYDLDMIAEEFKYNPPLYRWLCSEYFPDFGNACMNFPEGMSVQAPLLTIPSDVLKKDKSYQLSVTVTNRYNTTATAAVVLKVVAADIPVVTMAKVDDVYNGDEKIVLSATVVASIGTARITWMCNDALNVDLSVGSTTPLSAIVPTGSSVVQLSLRAGAVSAGFTYTFNLVASYTSATSAAATSVASVTIVINSPPSGGLLVVTPESGWALSTPFFLQSVSWSDDPSDYPLEYIFAYYVYRSDQQVVVRSRGEMSYAEAALGQGQTGTNAITCIVNASDSHGATAMASLWGVTVAPQTNMTAFAASAATMLGAAFEQSDGSAVSQVLTAVTSALNSVNCTVPTPCQTIKRQSCSTTALTCGPCLIGYMGISGDSNAPCGRVPAANRRLSIDSSDHMVQGDALNQRLLAGASSDVNLLKPGARCVGLSTTDVCISGSCVSGICGDSYKECPSDCSGHGVCVYRDVYGVPLAYCQSSNAYCYASCECQAGRLGLDCSMTTTAFEQAASLRAQLCTSLRTVVSLQDATKDVIFSRAAVIADVLIDLDQISAAALEKCATVLFETINNSTMLIGEERTASAYMVALSRIIRRGTAAPSSSSMFARANLAASNLMNSCRANLAIGESPVSIVTDTLRAVAAVSRPSAIGDLVLSIPSTDFESFMGVKRLRVAIDKSGSRLSTGSTMAIGVALMQITSNPLSFQLNSTTLSIQTTEYAVTSGRRILLGPASNIAFSATLVNYKPVEYGGIYGSKKYVQCLRSNQPYNVTGTCADGSVWSVQCKGLKGQWNVTCPSFIETAQCRMFDGTGFSVNPLCKATAYDATSTTCYCVASSSSRQLLAMPAVINREIASTLVIQNKPFLQLYIATAPLIVVEFDYYQVKATVAVVAACLVLLILMFAFDGRELVEARKSKLAESYHARTAGTFFNKLFPVEFQPGRWYKLWWSRLLVEHTWLCLVAPYNPTRDFRALKMAIAFGHLLTFLVINTILSYVFYSDDGICESIIYESECLNRQTMAGLRDSCSWNPSNDSCNFSEPVLGMGEFIFLFAAALIVTLCAVPVTKITDALTSAIFEHRDRTVSKELPWTALRDMQRVVPGSDGIEEYKEKTNVMEALQSVKSKLMKAARLRKIQEATDFLLPLQEAERLEKAMEARKLDLETLPHDEKEDEDAAKKVSMQRKFSLLPSSLSRKMSTLFIAAVAEEVVDDSDGEKGETKSSGDDSTIGEEEDEEGKHSDDLVAFPVVAKGQGPTSPYRQMQKVVPPENLKRASIFGARKPKIYSKIVAARKKAQRIKNDLQLIVSDEDKEHFLMSCFMLEYLRGFQRNIATRFLLVDGKLKTRKGATARMMFKYIAMILLPTIYAGMGYLIYYCNTSIASRSSTFWLVIAVIAVVQDAVFLQPFRVWFKCVAMPSYVSADIRELCRSIQHRFNFILTRRVGAMRDASSLIQHLNPTCRVARLLPHLPVSRFLISLNDFDIPYVLQSAERPRTMYSFFVEYIFVIPMAFIASLPILVSDTLIDILTLLIFNFAVYVVYSLSTVSVILGLLAVAGLGGVVLCHELLFRARTFRWNVDEDAAVKAKCKTKPGASIGGIKGSSRTDVAVQDFDDLQEDKNNISVISIDTNDLSEQQQQKQDKEIILVEEFVHELDSKITYQPRFKPNKSETTFSTRMRGPGSTVDAQSFSGSPSSSLLLPSPEREFVNSRRGIFPSTTASLVQDGDSSSLWSGDAGSIGTSMLFMSRNPSSSPALPELNAARRLPPISADRALMDSLQGLEQNIASRLEVSLISAMANAEAHRHRARRSYRRSSRLQDAIDRPDQQPERRTPQREDGDEVLSFSRSRRRKSQRSRDLGPGAPREAADEIPFPLAVVGEHGGL